MVRNHRGGIAGGRKVQRVESTADSIIRGIAVYMEIANGAHNELIRQKVLPTGIGIRLQVEKEFCMNLLINMCHLRPSHIQKLRDEIHKDEKKFDGDVLAFCDAVVPAKKRIIQSKNFQQEVAALLGKDRGVKKGRVII